MNAYTLVTVVLITLLAMSIIVVIGVFGGKVFRDRRDAKFERITRVARNAVLDDEALPALSEVYWRASKGNEFWQTALLTVFEEWESDGVFTDAALTSRVTPPNAAVTRDALMLQVDDEDPVKRGLAVALGGYPPVFLGTTTLAQMLNDPDGDTALAAAAALERTETVGAAWALIDALETANVPWARIVERLRHKWALPAIRAAIQERAFGGHGDHRPRLAYAVGLIGDPSMMPLLAALTSDPDPETRLNAIRSLALCTVRGDTVARSCARRLAHDPDVNVRTQAMSALGKVGDVDDIPLLLEGLTDSGWFARANAASALLELGPAGQFALADAVDHPDRYAAQQAQETLLRASLRRRASV